MRAAVLVIAALVAGCSSNPPAPVESELNASWTRVEVLDDGSPAGPISYILDCWNSPGGRRTVAVGVDVTSQILRLTPGVWTCQVTAYSDMFGMSEPSEPKTKLIP